MATISAPSPDRIEKVVEPYARELGKLVASWNTLHERLGELFSAVLNKSHPGIGSAIWYSTQNDRAQREMLRAATEAAAAEGTLTQQARDEIKWLLDRTNELANERNDAVHAPVALFTDQDGTKLMTEYFFGNRAGETEALDRLVLGASNSIIGWLVEKGYIQPQSAGETHLELINRFCAPHSFLKLLH